VSSRDRRDHQRAEDCYSDADRLARIESLIQNYSGDFSSLRDVV